MSLLLAAGAKPDAGVEDMASTVPRKSYMELEDLKAVCLCFPIRQGLHPTTDKVGSYHRLQQTSSGGQGDATLLTARALTKKC